MGLLRFQRSSDSDSALLARSETGDIDNEENEDAVAATPPGYRAGSAKRGALPEEEQSIPGHRGAGMAEEDLFQKAIEIDSKAMDAYFVFVVRCESYF